MHLPKIAAHAIVGSFTAGIPPIEHRTDTELISGLGPLARSVMPSPLHTDHGSATRTPVFAALLASHHQTVGKAEPPYSGNGSGRPKRSQRTERNLSSANCGTT